MKYYKNLLVLTGAFFILISCKKGGNSGAQSNTAPTNLVVAAVPATDGSGNVSFTASANNAVSYEYEFGNGAVATVASGATNYKYTLAGTNSYTVTVTAKSSTGLSLKKSIQVSVTVAAAPVGLFWSEEFNIDGAPDPLKWGYDLGTGSGGWGNNELEYYTSRPENAIVQGGVLKIKVIKEPYNGSAYSSARLLSLNKFAMTYGKVEIKAKLPAGVGCWPAIWMLGADIATTPWPACGEIDIMEYRGSEPNKIFGTFHYPGRSGGNADGGTKVISDATTQFHIYSLDWSASSIKIYVDNELVHTLANSGSVPFNHDFFFILNVAMGGNFGGAVDPAFTNATMEIDYIRVYK